MNVTEIIILMFPAGWLSLDWLLLTQQKPARWALDWLTLAASCFALSFFMIRKLSVLMGGGLQISEVIYYGWFLFALFVILRALKKGLRFVLEKYACPLVPNAINKSFIKIISFALLFILAVPFFLAMTAIHRPKVANVFNPQTALGLTYEEVTLVTKDQLEIKGWFVPANSKKAVVIAHGLGANKSNFLSTVEMWHTLGFNAFIFDFRGHGDSAGHTVSFGYKERYDVIAALDYLRNVKKFQPADIWGYGVSFGGAAMLQAVAEDPSRLGGLIIDSSFAELDHMAEKIVKEEAIIPSFCRQIIKEIGLFFLRVDLGWEILDRSPRRALGCLSGVPILFIHGKGDPLVPWTEVNLLYGAAAGRKSLVVFEVSGHYATLADPKYIQVVQDFIFSLR